jgi:hypothetical protein
MPKKNKGYSEILYGYLTKENKKFVDAEVKERQKITGNKLYSRSDWLNEMVAYHRTRKHHTPRSLRGKLVRINAASGRITRSERRIQKSA